MVVKFAFDVDKAINCKFIRDQNVTNKRPIRHSC